MCDKAADYYSHAIEFVSNCHKTEKMCDKAVDINPYAVKFVSQCYKTEKLCNRAVDTCTFVFDSVPCWYKTQKICNKVVSKESFILNYCLDRCKLKKKYVTKLLMFVCQHQNLLLIHLLQIKCLKTE